MPHPRRERVPALTLFLTSLPKPQFLFWPPGVLGTRTMAGSLVSLSEPPLYLGQRQEPWVPGCVTLDVRRVIREECLPPSKLTRGTDQLSPAGRTTSSGVRIKQRSQHNGPHFPGSPITHPGGLTGPSALCCGLSRRPLSNLFCAWLSLVDVSCAVHPEETHQAQSASCSILLYPEKLHFALSLQAPCFQGAQPHLPTERTLL